tara:strand:- start:154 stop:537 length:384 start_codon:yes stop_codon:yes gene_type:complete
MSGQLVLLLFGSQASENLQEKAAVICLSLENFNTLPSVRDMLPFQSSEMEVDSEAEISSSCALARNASTNTRDNMMKCVDMVGRELWGMGCITAHLLAVHSQRKYFGNPYIEEKRLSTKSCLFFELC